MKKRFILIFVLLVVIVFVIKTVYDAGEFKSITSYSEFTCTRVAEIPGPEDIVMDYSDGIAYISSDDRRAQALGKPVNGAIFRYDMDTKVYTRMEADLPFEFHPHGIDLFHASNDRTLLYVVNHRSDGHYVEKFQIKGNKLHYIKSIHDQVRMFSPNDLVMLNEDIFYITNDHGNSSKAGKLLEEYLQLPISYVLFYDGIKFEIKVNNIKFANGIAVNKDISKLFVASSTGREIRVYSIGVGYNLDYEYSIDCGTGVDNIAFDDEGVLWAGSHPQLLTFARHAKDINVRAPSEVISISFGDSGYTITLEFMDDGSLLQSSSVAVRYKSSLLVGSVFDTSILFCSI